MKEQKKLQSDFRITQYISVYLSSDSYLYQRCISFTSISTEDKELKKKTHQNTLMFYQGRFHLEQL